MKVPWHYNFDQSENKKKKKTSTSQAMKLILVENLLLSRRLFLSFSLKAGVELNFVNQFEIYNICRIVLLNSIWNLTIFFQKIIFLGFDSLSRIKTLPTCNCLSLLSEPAIHYESIAFRCFLTWIWFHRAEAQGAWMPRQSSSWWGEQVSKSGLLCSTRWTQHSQRNCWDCNWKKKN